MSTLVTADWHLSANSRDQYRFQFAEKILPKLIDQYEVDLLLFLGDVCEEKDEHSAELVNRVTGVFENLAGLCDIVCLQGNHDWRSSPANPFFGFLSRIGRERISWVSGPLDLDQALNLPADAALPGRSLLLPHSADYERDWGDIDFGGYSTVFAHQSFAGARSEGGFELGGVPLSYFPSRLKIVSGDIHRPQTVQNLTYVGAPYSVDFGDEIEGRVLVYDGNWQSVPVPGPQKRLIEIEAKEDLLKADVRNGDIVKVRALIPSYDIWGTVQDFISNWAKARGVVLHQATPVINSPLTIKTAAEKRSTKTDEELFAEYGKKRGLTDGYMKAGEKFL